MSQGNSLEKLKYLVKSSKTPLLGLQFTIYINEEEPSPFFCVLCKKNTTIVKSFNVENFVLHVRDQSHYLKYFSLMFHNIACELEEIINKIGKFFH